MRYARARKRREQPRSPSGKTKESNSFLRYITYAIHRSVLGSLQRHPTRVQPQLSTVGRAQAGPSRCTCKQSSPCYCCRAFAYWSKKRSTSRDERQPSTTSGHGHATKTNAYRKLSWQPEIRRYYRKIRRAATAVSVAQRVYSSVRKHHGIVAAPKKGKNGVRDNRKLVGKNVGKSSQASLYASDFELSLI